MYLKASIALVTRVSEVREQIRLQTAEHGRSMEAELRAKEVRVGSLYDPHHVEVKVTLFQVYGKNILWLQRAKPVCLKSKARIA